MRRAGPAPPGHRPPRAERLLAALEAHQVPLSMLALLGWLVLAAIRLPGDACYDLANYHLYAPFALLHGKLWLDLAPAQAQGYFPPFNDLPYYLLSRHISSVRLLNALLALPEAVALSLVFLLTLRLTGADTATERMVALVAVALGATGAATHPVLATSMSDMVPCALILAALLILLRPASASPGAPAAPVLAAGLLLGVALGLKLTLSYAAVGLLAGLLCWTGLPARARLRLAALVGAGAAAGLVACLGWWWHRLYAFSGNPMFPLYNQWFGSALAPPGDFVDRRFLPPTLAQALAYPFRWAVDARPLVTEPEQPMRDPRIAAGLLAAVALLAASLQRRSPVRGPVRVVAVLFLVGFATWERQFSIFRYLSLLELLSGPMLAILALELMRGPLARQATLNGAIVLLFLTMSWTVAPRWGRLPEPGGRPLTVSMPRLPDEALVLLLDSSPLGFLAAFQPASVRFYGTANNLVQHWVPTAMSARVRAGIEAQLRDRPEALWGLDSPDGRYGNSDGTLAAFRLRRTDCRTVGASIVYEPIRLCRLLR